MILKSEDVKKSRIKLISFFILLLFFVLGLHNAWNTGQTMDEAFFSGGGYPMVRYANYDALGEQPPFLIELGALPLLLIQPNYPIKDPVFIPGSNKIDISRMGLKFLYQMGNNPRLILFLERIPILIIALLLGYILMLWSYDLSGPKGALLSLLLYVLSPDIITHSSLFTMDLGVSAFFFITCYFLKRFFDTYSLRDGIITGVICGLALTSKISAILLLPIISLLFCLHFLMERPSGNIPIPKFTLSFIVLNIVLIVFCLSQKNITLLFVPICLFILSGFLPKKGTTAPKWYWLSHALWSVGWILCVTFALALKKKMPLFFILASLGWVLTIFILSLWFLKKDKDPFRVYVARIWGIIFIAAALVIVFIHLDFPKTLIGFKPFKHFATTFNHAMSHSLSSHKHCLPDSWVKCDWRYFPSLLLLKTPVATMIFFMVGFMELIRSSLPKFKKLLILIPPLFFFLFAAFINQINIGVRHILPTYPFIFLIAGLSISFLNKIKFSLLRRCIGGLFILLIILFSYRSVKNFPYYLSYFNEFVGTAEAGSKIVCDSNIIWAQDNLRLIDKVKELQIPHIKISSVGINPSEFDYYKISWSTISQEEMIHPASGYYALDLLVYDEIQKLPESWFKNRKPMAKAGNTYYLFQVE